MPVTEDVEYTFVRAIPPLEEELELGAGNSHDEKIMAGHHKYL